MLSDNNFRWLSRLQPVASAAGDPGREEALREAALLHLHLPCGIIRGRRTGHRNERQGRESLDLGRRDLVLPLS